MSPTKNELIPLDSAKAGKNGAMIESAIQKMKYPKIRTANIN
jgi:hypothetical protein